MVVVDAVVDVVVVGDGGSRSGLGSGFFSCMVSCGGSDASDRMRDRTT